MIRIQHNGQTFELEPVRTFEGAIKKNGGFFVNLVLRPGPTESVGGTGAWYPTADMALAEIMAS